MADLSTPTNDGQSEQTAESLITQHIDIWTTAIEQKSSAGRGSSKKFSLYGIKKLRELILELAVRGKLVPQDPNDEPASVLLERIAAEKVQLVKDKKIKKPKALLEIGEEEKIFELPHSWKWSRLNDISLLKGGFAFKSSLFLDDGLHQVIRMGNIRPDNLRLNEKAVFIPTEQAQLTEEYEILSGDILLTMTGTKGKRDYLYSLYVDESALEKRKLYLNQRLCIVRGVLVSQRFVNAVIKCDTLLTDIYAKSTGTANQANIGMEAIMNWPLPIPPLEEQHRIVAKVDELMSLCDALEAQTEASIAAHQTLVETLLNALIAETSGKTTMDGVHATHSKNASAGAIFDRVAEHFDTLFTTEASIDTLKQTILQLAVMGKLVEQDPSDEPAAKLLERIAAEKAQLIKDGKIKKQKPQPALTKKDEPFVIPECWCWVRLPDVTFFQEGPGILAKDFRENGVPLIRISGMHKQQVSLDGCNYLDEAMVAKKWEHFKLDIDDIVLSASASLGKVSKVGPETEGCIVYTGLIRFKPYSAILEDYLLKFFESSEFVRQIQDKSKGAAIKHFGPTHLNNMIIPVPPFVEQLRIVARVDELMALCDQLKARLSDAQTTQLQLTDAIVEQVV